MLLQLKKGDSSEDSDGAVWSHMEVTCGNMDIVKKTLEGIAAHSIEEGTKGSGMQLRFDWANDCGRAVT